MKKPKAPPPPTPVPPVRETGEVVGEKRKGQLMEERKRRGLRATLMSNQGTNGGGGNTLG